ncbi:putative LRR receptor-like serine/threonine-protein kinase [Platanthera guangdongensis]|uniref:LRR receptor-like serine/threonine-protein kinase n=1 Tax=Platanthera guangdongensis TaxID=2320717 RepID=A0ABR2MLR4_9ASPA
MIPIYQFKLPGAVAAAGIALTFLLFFTIRKGWLMITQFKTNGTGVKIYTFHELKKATKSFSVEMLIGSGAFGNVYRGVLDNETRTVAVKIAHSNSAENVEEFRNEVDLLSRIRHKNLVSLLGYCAEAGHMILVYEYVPHGTLLDYLVGGKGRNPLTWEERVTIAIGSAKGIVHLHEFEPPIIHRDLKLSNILVGDGCEAKISDFGLVRMGPSEDASHVTTQVVGTPGYIDPAYYLSHHLTTSSDVFSFGVILLQLVSSRPAIDRMRNKSHHHISNWAEPSVASGRVEEIIDERLQFEVCNMKVMLKMAQLGIRCTAPDPKNRPTMSQVVKELEEALQKATKSAQLSHLESRSISIDSVHLQRFYVESLQDLSFNSASMRCLDVDKLVNSNEGID